MKVHRLVSPQLIKLFCYGARDQSCPFTLVSRINSIISTSQNRVVKPTAFNVKLEFVHRGSNAHEVQGASARTGLLDGLKDNVIMGARAPCKKVQIGYPSEIYRTHSIGSIIHLEGHLIIKMCTGAASTCQTREAHVRTFLGDCLRQSPCTLRVPRDRLRTY